MSLEREVHNDWIAISHAKRRRNCRNQRKTPYQNTVKVAVPYGSKEARKQKSKEWGEL
jgi:hypothetical protein